MEKMTYEEYKIYTKINDLKRKLAETDYKAIKFAEGEITATEYAPVLAQRREYRAQINALETELNMLRGQ